jgi:hypothetical protein
VKYWRYLWKFLKVFLHVLFGIFKALFFGAPNGLEILQFFMKTELIIESPTINLRHSETGQKK